MKNRYLFIFFLLCLTTTLGFGQNPFEEGRKAYVETGNKAQLKRIISTFDANTISQNFVEYHKLCGDFHYLNADEDPRSYDSAERHFKQALLFLEEPDKATSQETFYYQFVLHEELGQLYYKQGHYKKAYDEMKEAESQSVFLDNDEDILDFISQLAICKARISRFQEAIDDINMVIGNYPEKKSERYGEALRKKAKILMLQQENSGKGMMGASKEAMQCYKEYYALKKNDALQHMGDMSAENREQYWMHLRPFIVDCYRTESTDPAFLYDVTLFGKSLLLEYAQKGKPQSFTWKQVQSKLQPTDCAIEFIQYEKYGDKHMAALVLKKKGEPKFVRIGKVDDIKNLPLFEDSNLSEAVAEDNAYLKDMLYSDSSLFQYIWTPELLMAIGKDTKRLYFAAEGLFHELAIEYMLPEMPQMTSLKTENLYRLTSTRQLLAQSSSRRSGKVLLGGGFDFFKASSSAAQIDDDYTNDEQAYRYLKSLDVLFGFLNGTVTEINGIQQEYDQEEITLLTDSLASETNVVSLIKHHSIVHLATHGFYFGFTPEGTDLLPASYDESLSQSGIALAGCNATLRSDEFNALQHDGILSSREIAQMDFSGVDVIVLSACQTALGYMTDDGIFGLQRSLKNAGVKAMVLSLWSVDDDATSALMQAFHRHLQAEDIHTAFMRARQELIETARNPGEQFNAELLTTDYIGHNFDSPYYYNAFILIDIK